MSSPLCQGQRPHQWPPFAHQPQNAFNMHSIKVTYAGLHCIFEMLGQREYKKWLQRWTLQAQNLIRDMWTKKIEPFPLEQIHLPHKGNGHLQAWLKRQKVHPKFNSCLLKVDDMEEFYWNCSLTCLNLFNWFTEKSESHTVIRNILEFERLQKRDEPT